ncbi:MAG TPA: hypothetical protein P5181_12405 [Dermatophilaceae bacterium]|nr:hypothetical protein [Dermatophilaceae bacterium]
MTVRPVVVVQADTQTEVVVLTDPHRPPHVFRPVSFGSDSHYAGEDGNDYVS